MPKAIKTYAHRKYPETATKPNVHEQEHKKKKYIHTMKVYLYNGYYSAIKRVSYQYMQ